MVKIRKHSIRHNFISVQDTETICACIVGFLLSSNSDMLCEFSVQQTELMATEISQNGTTFSSVQDIENFFK